MNRLTRVDIRRAIFRRYLLTITRRVSVKADGMLYRERPRIQFNIYAGSITIFRYPIHFTLCRAKRRASGMRICLRARARARKSGGQAIGGALLSKIASAARIIVYECVSMRRTRRRTRISSREMRFISRQLYSILAIEECERKSLVNRRCVI